MNTLPFILPLLLILLLAMIKAKHQYEFLQKRKENAENELKDAKKAFEYEICCYERENTRLRNLLEICYKSKPKSYDND